MSWIQRNDGTLDSIDATLAEDVDAQLANDPRMSVVAWPAVAQLFPSRLSLAQVAAAVGAKQLLLILVRNEGSIRQISVFLVDEPQNRKRLALRYYADASLSEPAVRDAYAQRIERALAGAAAR